MKQLNKLSNPNKIRLYTYLCQLEAPQGGKNQTAPFLSSPLGGSEGGCGDQTQYLFHLIVQMQREGAIRFTQLIAEKDYRWLHISYVPGMLRNQIIDVNVKTNVNDNDDDNHQPEGKHREAQSTLASTLSLEEKSALTLERDYQDSG